MKAIYLCLACAFVAVVGLSVPQQAPGNSVADDEAAAMVGGGCVGVYPRPCSGPGCAAGVCMCLDPAWPKAKPQGNACDSNCSMWAYGIGCTGTAAGG